MKIRIAMFAAAKEMIDGDFVELDLPEAATLKMVKSALACRYPGLKELLSRSMFSVDQQYAADETEIGPESEVAMIPPVSGG